jgi:DNA-directed RNA polymerase specialized sigma24 family protein
VEQSDGGREGAHDEAQDDAHETDAGLMGRVRGGDDAAWAQLRARHEPDARRLADRLAGSTAPAAALVDGAFVRTRDDLRAGGGADTAFRPYLLSTLRRVAALDGLARGGAPDDAVEAEERDAVWAAWRSLPDESRSLLWRLAVHEEQPHQIAPALGTTSSGLAGRSRRARERLRRAFLSELVAKAGEPDCRAVRRQLGGYLRDDLLEPARQQVDDHLDGCARCRAAVLDAVDLDAAILLRVAPVLLPGAFAGAVAGAAASAVADEAGAGEMSGTDEPSGDDGTAAALAESWVPVPVGVAWLMDGAEDDRAHDDDPEEEVFGRVVSVPGRSVAAVLAAAALLVAAALFLTQLEPSGQVAADSLVAQASSPGSVDGGETDHPDETSGSADASATAPRPVIGVATAEGVSRYQSSGGRAGSQAQAAVGTGGSSSSASRRPRTSPTSTSTAARPTSTSARPTTNTPTATVSPVGTVTSLAFTPSDRGYSAHLEVPGGWAITSVRDVKGARVREHVDQPVTVFDGRLGGGDLVVEVTRVRPDVTGALTAVFTDRSGAPLPGSGAYLLR